MIKREQKIKENIMFSGRIFTARCDDVIGTTGKRETREFVLHNGGVGVVPIDGDDVILVRQYRYAFNEETLEIPAGKLNKGEDHLECGRRELAEEAGAAGDMTYLTGMKAAVGYSNEITHIYLAENLRFFEPDPDEGEEIETVRLNIAEAVNMINNGEITDSKTVIGILLADIRRKQQ